MKTKNLLTLFLTALLWQSVKSDLPSISDFFSSLWGQTEVDGENKEREKRQTPEGDSNSEIHLSSNDDVPRFKNGSINFDHMPTLSNGHIGFTPYSNAIFLNGLYNGKGGESHRAKIPALVMAEITLGTPAEESRSRTSRNYTLNAEDGVFTLIIQNDYLFVEQTLYVHQKYDKVFVHNIYTRAKPNQRDILGGTLTLKYPEDIRDEDLTGFRTSDFRGDSVITAQTKVPEVGTKPQSVSYIWTAPDETITVRHGERNVTYLMAVDHSKSRAENDFQACLNVLYQQGYNHKLYEEHADAWRKTWDRGRIETIGTGDRLVSKLIKFSQYYLLSNLPAYDANQPQQKAEFLYGVGRQSLGKGAKGQNQQGHVFWDSEVYVLPAILPTHPDLAKKILEYRAASIQQAQEYAKATGYKGYRYPWESAFSGVDVTPDNTCSGCRDRQIHVGAGISWAIRQYYSLTRNQDFEKNSEFQGCNMAINIAKFYAGKAKYDSNDGRYHIRDVMGPDDYHDHVDDNAYTNAAASLAIHWGRYMACMCDLDERQEVSDDDIAKALHLKLSFDDLRRVHHAFNGYQNYKNKSVKQADTVLLGYPLNWNMSDDIKRNDLYYYDKEITDDTPALTYSFMAIGWKSVKETIQLRAYFQKSYSNYVIQPFKVWKEYSNGGTVNFLPGMGGFLQSIIYGYAGLHIRPEMLEFHNPMPPEGLEGLRFHGFHYLGAKMTITIYTDKVDIELHSIGNYPLVVVRNYTSGKGEEDSIKPGEKLTVKNPEGGFFIYSTRGTSCDHPRDYIYMPWGYSPFINGSDKLVTTPLITCLLYLVTALFGILGLT